MKEVNANIIYTKVSPTEYIGEFTVSPEETTDYELRAIDDENVVEKCEVQVEQEVLPEDEFKIYVNNSLAEDMGRYTSNDGGLFELRATSKYHTVSELNYVVLKPVGTGVIVYEPISQGAMLVDNESQVAIESPDWDGYNQVKVEVAGNISFFVNKVEQP